MKHVSLFRLPIFWLFMGPPALRAGGWGHSALESMQSSGQDIWNIIRLVWWMVFGLVALAEVMRDRETLYDMLSRLGSLHRWVGLLMLTLLASAAVAPMPMFTLVNASMFVVMVFAALDLALKIYRGVLTIERSLRLLLYVSTGMLVLVQACLWYDPWMVGADTFMGFRVRGNNVAYTPILAQTMAFVSYYFWTKDKSWKRLIYLALMGWCVYWLYISQTRSAYLSLFLGIFLLAWYWGNMRRNLVALVVLGALVGILLTTLTLLYDVSDGVKWRYEQAYERFVLRDRWAVEDEDFARENLASLNGRSEVVALLSRHAWTQPLGLGYVTGPRVLLQSEDAVEELQSAAFGNAHNAFVEIWAGGGYLALLGYLALIFLVLRYSSQLAFRPLFIMRLLCLLVLFEGLFESDLVLPFKQSLALFWWVSAGMVAIYARQVRYGTPTAQTTSAHPPPVPTALPVPALPVPAVHAPQRPHAMPPPIPVFRPKPLSSAATP